MKHPVFLSSYCLRKCRVWRGPSANKKRNCQWLPEVLAETDTRVRFHVGFHSTVSNGQSLGVYNHIGTDCRESGKNNEKNVNSNSNLSEGHIPNRKCSAGHSLLKKLVRAEIDKKSFQNKLNLIKIYNSSIFWDGRGPHKFIWRATCGPWAAFLRPLCLYVLVNYFLGCQFWPLFVGIAGFPRFSGTTKAAKVKVGQVKGAQMTISKIGLKVKVEPVLNKLRCLKRSIHINLIVRM